MKIETKNGFNGLSAYQIKIIALFFMSLDHLGAYCFDITIIGKYYSLLRILGRIAAPLFLYMLTESVRYTHSRKSLIIRLYCAAVLLNTLTLCLNHFGNDIFRGIVIGNIFFTYFYIALYISLTDSAIKSFRTGAWKRGTAYIALIASTGILHPIFRLLCDVKLSNGFLKELLMGAICSPFLVDYTILFVILGVLMYFARNKYEKIIIFICFCFVSRSSYMVPVSQRISLLSDFFGSPQYWMILAAPFMMLYNGNRGKPSKWAFYIYYPLHIYLLVIIEAIMVR